MDVIVLLFLGNTCDQLPSFSTDKSVLNLFNAKGQYPFKDEELKLGISEIVLCIYVGR